MRKKIIEWLFGAKFEDYLGLLVTAKEYNIEAQSYLEEAKRYCEEAIEIHENTQKLIDYIKEKEGIE